MGFFNRHFLVLLLLLFSNKGQSSSQAGLGSSLYGQTPALLNNTFEKAKEHLWGQLTLGIFHTMDTQLDPSSRMGVRPSGEDEHGLMNEAVIGTYPYHLAGLDLYAFYRYHQLWFTDEERIDTYGKNPTDFEYQPFRSDLSQRQHVFAFSLAGAQKQSWQGGLFCSASQEHFGTKASSEVETFEAYHSSAPSYRFLNMPWLAFHWNNHHRTQLYLSLHKDLHLSSEERSHQTFPEHAWDWKHYSFGLHQKGFLREDISYQSGLSYHQIIYNDPWLDRTRQGIHMSLAYEISSSFFLEGHTALYREIYALPRLKIGGCQVYNKELLVYDDDNLDPSSCPREDRSTYYQIRLAWDWRIYAQFSLSYKYSSNKNPVLREFDVVRKTILLNTSLNFPSGQKVRSLMNEHHNPNVYDKPQEYGLR